MHFGANQSLESDERKSAFRIDLLLQVHGAFRENQFAGGADVSFDQVAALRGAVLTADDHVRVDLRFVIFDRNVADEREKLDLFVQVAGDFVLFGFPIEPAKFCSRKRADGLETAPREILLLGEAFQARGEFFAGVKDQHKSFGFLIDLLEAHVFPRVRVPEDRPCGVWLSKNVKKERGGVEYIEVRRRPVDCCGDHEVSQQRARKHGATGRRLSMASHLPS